VLKSVEKNVYLLLELTLVQPAFYTYLLASSLDLRSLSWDVSQTLDTLNTIIPPIRFITKNTLRQAHAVQPWLSFVSREEEDRFLQGKKEVIFKLTVELFQ